jgi:maltose alpha-D-glucosyltransferase/alpha-amylase
VRARSPVALPVRFEEATWYKDAVIYEVHVRAFRDANGDGVGDFRGLTEKLDYLRDLGVTALWLLPFYPSPLRDDGYDISDYRKVHPSYGTLRDFKALLRAAHDRGLRVITELVLAHTSDEHPWFQRARRAAPGSVERDFYTWSDSPDRYRDARIIFKDFETSNWAWDPLVKQYYWHRFYSHQPSLNYDNPAVRAEMFDVVDHWLEMGVDGLRLDAVPYLFAREGTTSENLPETIGFLRDLRRHVDERFPGRMLLAEANQWPEDAVAYLGDGDTCHMAFHFPLMPRMFMAARQEDRYPIVDILTETPPIPESCQWALFLRNHDELTLEMVTDEERDYMYRVYAEDPQARVNVGIRRRLAPLLGNDRNLIEMMNGLLFSMPGTPIIYYGDEIGMGDNIYLGDRDAVRTPMQWDGDRNAGFSEANPQQLYLPVVIDPEYQTQAVNVAAQEANSSSLLWWMKRLIALRNRYSAFARGSFEVLRSDNRKVLAFLRRLGDETILVAVNLSRFTQAAELDLADLLGTVPVELFGGSEFPQVGDLPYLLTLGPHGFYWFSLERRGAEARPLGQLSTPGPWSSVFTRQRDQVCALLIEDLPNRRWFRAKSRRIRAIEIVDATPVARGDDGTARFVLLLIDVAFDRGPSERYAVPLTFLTGERASEIARHQPESVVGELAVGGVPGLLVDATVEPSFATAALNFVARRRQLPVSKGRLVGVPTPAFRRTTEGLGDDPAVVALGADQSNTSLGVGNRVVIKLLRHIEAGINPDVEIGRYLNDTARFPHAPTIAGHLEFREHHVRGPASTVLIVEQLIANEGDGWHYVLDALARGLEEVVARAGDRSPKVSMPASLFDAARSEPPPDDLLVGPHLQWVDLLGRRTAELHLALSSSLAADFVPEPLGAIDRQAMVHAARGVLRRAVHDARALRGDHPRLAEVLDREVEIRARLDEIRAVTSPGSKIRVHGDYHLGQVLWTGKDFVVIDFEGEPARPLATRRLRRPALVDVAGMIRSFDYAARMAARRLGRDLLSTRDPERIEPLLTSWYRWVAGSFLRSYFATAGDAPFLPGTEEDRRSVLEFALLEKAIYEVGYEANNRPEQIEIPARGVIELLGPRG